MKRFLIAVYIIPLLILVLPTTPASAQATWCYFWDFTATSGDWTASNMTYSAGQGWSTLWDSGYGGYAGSIRRVVDREIYFVAIAGTGLGGGTIANLMLWEYGGSRFYFAENTYLGYWEVETTLYVNTIQLYVESYPGNFIATGIVIRGYGTNPYGTDNCEGGGEPGNWIRPFQQGREADWGLFDINLVDSLDMTWRLFDEPVSLAAYEPDANLVAAFSLTPNEPVMAATSGTVQDIIPLAGYCDNFITALFVNCDILVPDPIGKPGQGGQSWLYEQDIQSYLVRIQTPYGILRYIVNHALDYLTVGQSVTPGCILGTSYPLTPSSWFRTGFFDTPPSSYGAALILLVNNDDTESQPLLPALTEYASPDFACNANPAYAACLNADPEMRFSGQFWQATGPVLWQNEGNAISSPYTRWATISPNASIEQQLNLDPEVTYSVAVVGTSTPGGSPFQQGRMAVRLGQTTTDFTLTTAASQNTVPANSFEPDIGEFFSLRITNTGNISIDIFAVCVSETEPDFSSQPACFLVNAYFDNSGANWTASGGATFVPGAAILPDDASISQSLSLEPGTYQLEVDARLKVSSPFYTGASGSADVTYTWDGSPESLGPLDMRWNVVGNPGYPSWPQVLSDTLTVTSPTTETLTIAADFSGNEDVEGIYIERVCVIGDVPPPVFEFTCATVPIPTSNDLGAWIMYHWRNLDRFFQCELMVLLNKLYRSVDSGFKMIGWSFRWNMTAARMQTNWLATDVFPWLGGHFRNMAIGSVTTIEGGASTNLWDVLRTLIELVLGPLVSGVNQIVSLLVGLIGGAGGILFSAIQAAISILLTIITQALGLLALGQQLLGTIIAAYNNAAPVVIPGLPTCGLDPRSSPFCIGLWVLDNTIFAPDSPGSAVIPLITSILSIHLILWVVGELKRTVTGVGAQAG